MTSEKKKKRIPKPPMTWAVDGVIRLIPFFGAKTPEERVKRAIEFVEWNGTQIGSKELNDALAQSLEENKHVETLTESVLKNSQEQIDVIEEAHTQLADAIRIALHQEKSNGYSFNTQEWLEKALSLSFRKVTWANRPYTNVSYEFRYELIRNANKELMGFCYYAGLKFKNLAAGYVCEAFSSWGGRSIGEFYIGACPKCGKIFKKLQSNTEFCSKKCGNTSRQEAFKNKQRL